MLLTQTTYLAYTVSPSGRRMTRQVGTHAFTTGDTTVTLTVHFKRLVAGQASPEQVLSSSKTGMAGSYLPYVSSTMFTQPGCNYRVVISRKTGSISGLKFAYDLIGW